MTEILLAVGLRFVAVVGALQLLLGIIGTNAYELQAIKRRRTYLQHPHARRLRQRPLVTVVIVAHNDEGVVAATLTSVLESSYRNLEIIVVDNASTDHTKQSITDFMAAHPKNHIRLFAKRSFAATPAAMLAGYKRYGTGVVVMTLPAGYRLHKQALSQAITYCNADDTISSVVPKLSISSAYSVLGILQHYRDLLGYRSQKANSAFRAIYGVEQVMIYRQVAFLATARTVSSKRLPSIGRAYYAEDVVVYVRPPESFLLFLRYAYTRSSTSLAALYEHRRLLFARSAGYTKFLTWCRMPLAIGTSVAAFILPFLTAYFVYLAVKLQAPTYLVVLCALLSLVLLFAIWDDAELTAWQKLTYSVGIPLTYGYFVLLNLIEALAVMSTLCMLPFKNALPAKLPNH